MASRLVAGLAHIFLFRKLCKKLRPHRREFCTEFFKPIPMDGYKNLLRRVKERIMRADTKTVFRLSPVLADVRSSETDSILLQGNKMSVRSQKTDTALSASPSCGRSSIVSSGSSI